MNDKPQKDVAAAPLRQAPRRQTASRRDVARLAGVTPAAVSQVLNNLPNTRISPAVREKILASVRQLGYRPHPIARALAAGKTHIIGVLMFEIDTPFSAYASSILGAAWRKFEEESHSMLIRHKGPEEDIAPIFREEGWCDGYLAIAPVLRLRGAASIPDSRYACVCIGSRPDGIDVSYTDLDNLAAGRMAVDYLVAKGHRKIAHISGPLTGVSSARDRYEGYRQGLSDHGLPFHEDLVANGSFLSASGGVAMEALLRKGREFTAVFSANDGMARGAIAMARARGLNVPGDISIIGVSDNLVSDDGSSAWLTTIEQPVDKIGAEAATLLLRHIVETPHDRRPLTKLYPGRIIERATVRSL